MTEIKGTFVTESELRNETVNLGNDVFAQIRGVAKKLDELTKFINKPNDYVDLDTLKTKLQLYTMKEDVEDMIAAQRIDSKAPKQQVIDLQSQVKLDFVRFDEKMKELYASKAYVQNEIGKIKAHVSHEFVSQQLLQTKLQTEHETHEKFTSQLKRLEGDLKKYKTDL